MTRAEARAQGATHFYSGKPCPRGHICERFVSTGNCVECNRERHRIKNMTDEQILKQRAAAKKWAQENPEEAKEKWNWWAFRNTRKVSAYSRFMYLKRKKRVPPWLSKEEKQAILEFYKNCPKGYEVDHIIPLNGKFVSGLHVLNNLQYLPVTANRKKGNTLCTST